MDSVLSPTGHSIVNAVALLSSPGNSSNPTIGASMKSQKMKNQTGAMIDMRRKNVFSRNLLKRCLYHSVIL
jgi:hypothetical protein